MNVVALLGRLTADPELKTTQSGIAVCAFSIAVDRRFLQDGKREADFIRCVAWRQTAEFVSKHFFKGKMIAVQGSLQTRSYEDRNGDKRTVCEVVVASVSFAGDKQSGGGQGPAYQSGSLDDFEEISSEEDLPF